MNSNGKLKLNLNLISGSGSSYGTSSYRLSCMSSNIGSKSSFALVSDGSGTCEPTRNSWLKTSCHTGRSRKAMASLDLGDLVFLKLSSEALCSPQHS